MKISFTYRRPVTSGVVSGAPDSATPPEHVRAAFAERRRFARPITEQAVIESDDDDAWDQWQQAVDQSKAAPNSDLQT